MLLTGSSFAVSVTAVFYPDHPSWRHGMRAREWIEARAEINELVREAKEIERMLCGGAF